MRSPAIRYVDPDGDAHRVPLFSRVWYAVACTLLLARLVPLPHVTPGGQVIDREDGWVVFRDSQSPWSAR